jgi:hypothetical protein
MAVCHNFKTSEWMDWVVSGAEGLLMFLLCSVNYRFRPRF